MNPDRLNNAWHHAILRAASLVAPAAHRAEWLNEWETELWYVPESEATRFCLGAFRDALWVRRNDAGAVKRRVLDLDSPVRCIAFLAAVAALSLLISVRLQRMLPFPQAHGPAALRAFGQMLFLYLVLATVSLVIEHGPGDRRPMPNSSKFRGWIFLALKFALVLPILQCTTLFVIVLAPFLTLALVFSHAVLVRWVFVDQRRRCPVCLRLLTKPVRIGDPSQTFLEWYGVESMCERGHGLLYDPEILASYSRERQWLKLDVNPEGSLGGLFSEAAGMRQ